MLYASAKVGLFIPLQDLGINVLCDLIEYSAKIDAEALDAKGGVGKNSFKMPPMNLSQMTKAGRLKG